MNFKASMGFFAVTALTLALIIGGIIAPWLVYNDIFLCFLLVLIVVLSISAAYSIEFHLFRLLTWTFFVLAVIANIFWFFVLEYSVQFYILYFFLYNLCIIFLYTLLFIIMPSYANRYQHRYEISSFKGYHIHENLYGILIVLFGLAQFLLSWLLLPNWHDPLIFWLDHFLLFFGTACIIVGAFLIGRDYNDLKDLRFIERQATRKMDPNFTIRANYYHLGKLGIIFNLFGLMFFFQSELWGSLFGFPNSALFILFGLILTILGASMFGMNSSYFAKKTQAF
jgi:Ca2+/Na+ antiporter